MIDIIKDSIDIAIDGSGAGRTSHDQNAQSVRRSTVDTEQIYESKENVEISPKEDIQKLQNQVQSPKGSIDVEAVYTELEALSYSISHDLRAPLRAIRSNCDWLHSHHAAELNTEGRRLLQQISESSELMENLLDALLAFSRVVESNPQHEFVDMTSVVQAVIEELLKYEGGLSSLDIHLKPLLPAYGDVTLLRQVWYNLLSNAFKFTRYRQKREVEIHSERFNGEIVYSVSDNGVGFDMQYMDRLFGAFHRLHDYEEFEGTGVGLAIVKRIIRRHNGRVWAESVVDKGARFYFTLPKKAEE